MDRDPTLDEKLLLIHAAYDRAGIPHAFGGAISLNYHRDPRSTTDIDLNVFVAPEHAALVFDTLGTLFPVADRDRHIAEVSRDGQTRVPWNSTLVDHFFSELDFHDSMARRAVMEQFGDSHIPVLSIEDLVVCKAAFNRPKDWLDIEAVAQTRRGALDTDYVYRWASEFFAEDSEQMTRLRGVLESEG